MMVRKETLDMIEAVHWVRLDAVKQQLADKEAEIERLNDEFNFCVADNERLTEENAKLKERLEVADELEKIRGT